MASAFYYDIVCPYAYMAFSFLKKHDVFKKNDIQLKPILLGGLYKLLQQADNPNSVMPKMKADYVRKDIIRQADYFSVLLKFHPRYPVSTVKAMRLIHACDLELREEITKKLFHSYFVDNLDIDKDEVIDQIAQEFSAPEQPFSYDTAKTSLIDATKEAFDNKIFGVPTMVIDDRIYFGGDRLCLLQDELGITLPDAPWQKTSQAIDFYFDFSSPYSYLAWAEVKKARAAGVLFNLKPVLLGALFKEVGTPNIPMLAHPNKTNYFMKDMADWAKYRQVPFRFNSHFPIRTVTPLRIALLDERVIDPIFTAAWAHDIDVGDPSQLEKVLNQALFDGAGLLNAAEDEHIKSRLKDNTSHAVERGVFGVPTFFVKGQQVFGQDRFSWIRRNSGLIKGF